MYNPSNPAPSTSAGGVQDIFNSWVNVLTKPSIQTFQMEIPKASQNKTMMAVGIAVAISAVLGLLNGVYGPIGGLIWGLLTPVILFVLSVAGLYVGAVVVNKGSGTIEQQAWVQSTYWAPLSIVGSVLGLIPFLGPIASFAIWIYQLYLTYLAVQAVHRLDSNKAIVSMIVWAAVAILGSVLVFGILGLILGGIFVVTSVVS